MGGGTIFQFLESVLDGGKFHCTNSGKGLKYSCLERGLCLTGISANDAVNEVNPQRKMKSALHLKSNCNRINVRINFIQTLTNGAPLI